MPQGLGAPGRQPDPDRGRRRRPRHRRRRSGPQGAWPPGLITAEQAEQLTAAQKTALVFKPGLSTAEEVTAISGRGVGMDVVRANIERIGGVVDVDSQAGPGRPPLHPGAAHPHHHPGADGQRRRPGLRHPALGDRGDPARRRRRGPHRRGRRGRGRDDPRPARAAGRARATCSASRRQRAAREQKLILLKPAGGDVYALAVDAVHDHEELVVKPAAPAVMAAGLYAGTTLADDGRRSCCSIPPGMAKCAGHHASTRASSMRCSRPPASRRRRARPACCCSATLDGGRRAVPVAAGRADRGRSGRGDPAQRRPAPRRARRADPAAGRLRRPRRPRASCASCASPTASPRSPTASPRSIDIRARRARRPAGAGAGRGRRRRPDRRRAGRDARSLLAVRRPWRRRVRRRRPAGLRAARGRSLDGEYASPADREPRLSGRRRRRRRRRRHRDRSRRGGGSCAGSAAQVLRIRSQPDAAASDDSIYRYDRAALLERARAAAPRRDRPMAELLLIVRLAGRRVAFPAAEVEAVVELEGLTPVPRAAGHVAGLSALRSRVLTVIDGLASLELGRAGARRSARRSSSRRTAILMPCWSRRSRTWSRRRRRPRRSGAAGRRLGPGRDGMVEADGELLPARRPASADRRPRGAGGLRP